MGGFAALAGAIVLGPRLGKYNEDGTANAIPGHNLTLSAVGAFILCTRFTISYLYRAFSAFVTSQYIVLFACFASDTIIRAAYTLRYLSIAEGTIFRSRK